MITVSLKELKQMIKILDRENIEFVDIDITDKESISFDGYDGTGTLIDFGIIEHQEIDMYYNLDKNTCEN